MQTEYIKQITASMRSITWMWEPASLICETAFKSEKIYWTIRETPSENILQCRLEYMSFKFLNLPCPFLINNVIDKGIINAVPVVLI